jgi:hypothetical protein
VRIAYIPPSSSGGGGGGSGLTDVTGTYPIEVDSLGSTRNVSINDRPNTGGVTLGRGVAPRQGRYRTDHSVALNNTTSLSAFNVSQTAPSTQVLAANTSYYASAVRTRYTSVATADRTVVTLFQSTSGFRGLSALTGGFMVEFCLGYAALNANSRLFFGLTNSVFTSTNPSAMASSTMGFAIDAADTHWSFIHNDSTGGTCTKVPTTIPRPTVLVDVFYGAIWCDPAVSQASYYMQRRDDPTQFATGTVGTKLYLNTLGVIPRIDTNTGPTTAVAVSHDFMRFQFTAQL